MVKILGTKSLERGIKLRALDDAINIEKNFSKDDSTCSLNDLFSTVYIPNKNTEGIRNYIINRETAFMPESLKYFVDKHLEYSDISYME